ncbi:MAG: hypothetical protein J0I98_05200 [Mesorhizobium sp.]|nr:DUF2946 family protein [Mesorhizobium sp.]MBN9242170.1 hypothetical protein [Mesorhizobium sp.]MBN9272496.1 hypothetical protein [Mesorhizobium sp.]
MPVAFAAAYVLVLQTLLGAFALGTGTDGQTDAFGNVICTHAGAAEQPAGSPQGHQPSCCALGCAFSASGLGTPPDALPALKIAFVEIGATVAAVPERPLFSRHRSQANPRAPPALA